MLRLMARLEINMHIRPLDIRQTLQLELELFGDVVRGAKGFIGVHDNVDFDNDARAGVVGADGVKAEDHGRVCHCYGVLASNHDSE